jgi:hypothetical protein
VSPAFEATAPASDEDLLREIRGLRETVEALRREVGERQRVTLRVLQEGPFLGQPVNVVAAVTGSGGEPRVNVPVTFTATWGRLRAVEDLRLREGSGVTARTDGEGRARVVLLPPAIGDDSAAQQDALQVALRLLDRGAPTPQEAAGGLRELARQYRLDGNAELRQEIDLYLQELGQRWRDSFESRVHAVWSTFDTTVFAFARDADPEDEDVLDTAVLAMAALPLRFKDWLGPWLQALAEVMREEAGLEGELRKARDRFREPDALLGHVYGRVQLFLDTQKGTAGELAGRRAAERSLRGFLNDGLPELPKETRAGVLRGIEVASGTLKSAGAGVLAAVGQTRKDLTLTIDRKIADVPKVDLSGVTGRLDQLAVQVTSKADVVAVEGLRAEVGASLAVKADRTALETLSAGFTREIGTLKDTTVKLNDRVSRIDTSVIHVTADLTALNTDLSTKILAKADAVAIEGLRAEVGASLAAKADQTALTALSTNVIKEIGTLKDTTVKLNEGLVRVDTSVNRIDTTIRNPQIFRRVDPNG